MTGDGTTEGPSRSFGGVGILETCTSEETDLARRKSVSAPSGE